MPATSRHARAVAALGHDARLLIFSRLAKAGETGLRVSNIGAHPGLAPSALAHHLSTLVDAGLVLRVLCQNRRVWFGAALIRGMQPVFEMPRAADAALVNTSRSSSWSTPHHVP